MTKYNNSTAGLGAAICQVSEYNKYYKQITVETRTKIQEVLLTILNRTDQMRARMVLCPRTWMTMTLVMTVWETMTLEIETMRMTSNSCPKLFKLTNKKCTDVELEETSNYLIDSPSTFIYSRSKTHLQMLFSFPGSKPHTHYQAHLIMFVEFVCRGNRFQSSFI